MKKIFVIGAAIGAVVIALGAAGLVYAQTQTPPSPNSPYGGFGPGFGGGMHGPGMMGGGFRGQAAAGSYGPLHEYMINAFAEALGLDAGDLEERLAAGETLFEVAEAPIPDPADGQLLIRNAYFSVDPYMRPRMNDVRSYVAPFTLGEAMTGGAVGQVVVSRSRAHAEGSWVVHGLGWREWALSDGSGLLPVDPAVIVRVPYQQLHPLGLEQRRALTLRHVTEQVVFMGTAWKWVWMYEVGGRKLGYLHPMETSVSGTFVVTQVEEHELAMTDGLPRPLRQAMRDGALASGVRWCWLEFPDLEAVDAFVHVIRLKHHFLARPE